MVTYEAVVSPTGADLIKRDNGDGTNSWIPTDPANSDYQRYLAWLENPEAEQSTPIVIDEAETK